MTEAATRAAFNNACKKTSKCRHELCQKSCFSCSKHEGCYTFQRTEQLLEQLRKYRTP